METRGINIKPLRYQNNIPKIILNYMSPCRKQWIYRSRITNSEIWPYAWTFKWI